MSAFWDYVTQHPGTVEAFLAFLTSTMAYMKARAIKKDAEVIKVRVNGHLTQLTAALRAQTDVMNKHELPSDYYDKEVPIINFPRKDDDARNS